MQLFDNFDRTDEGPREYSESHYAFLNRSARPGYENVRKVMSEWLNDYPIDGQSTLKGRLKAQDEHKFHASFLELYTHELLRLTRHSIAVECAAANDSRPDFLVQANDGVTSFVECSAVTEESDAEQTTRGHLERCIEMIDEIKSPDFFICVNPLQHSKESPSLKTWKREIEDWLLSLDYERQIDASINGSPIQSKLELIFPKHRPTCRIEVSVIPKSRDARGKSTRSRGAHFTSLPSGMSNCDSTMRAIQKKLSDKGSHYGNLDRPLVLVLNCIGSAADVDEIRAAFWGPRGVWSNPLRAKHKSISAVVAFHHLLPWSITRTATMIVHNPNAAVSYTGPLSSLPECTSSGVADGCHPRDYLLLDRSWPFLEL